MQRFRDSILVNGHNGLQPLPNALISVFVAGTATLATIYSNNENAPQQNPFRSSAEGVVAFYAEDGRYDIKAEGAGYATVWVRDLLFDDSTDEGYVREADISIKDGLIDPPASVADIPSVGEADGAGSLNAQATALAARIKASEISADTAAQAKVDALKDDLASTGPGLGAESVARSTVFIGSVPELLDARRSQNLLYSVRSYHPGVGVGGLIYEWSPSTEKTKHNGGSIIDPDKSFPSNWVVGQSSWFAAADSGIGCFVSSPLEAYIECFGAIPGVDCWYSVNSAAQYANDMQITLTGMDIDGYQIGTNTPIVVRTNLRLPGMLSIPSTLSGFYFRFERDDVGEIIDALSLGPLTRGQTSFPSSLAGKTLLFSSSEVLIERTGSGGEPYTKQEVVVVGDIGRAQNALVNTYTDLGSLIVTAYETSKSLFCHVKVQVQTSGGTGPSFGYIYAARDNVEVFEPWVKSDVDQINYGIRASYCANTRIIRPRLKGFNRAGAAYGISTFRTTGAYIEDPIIENAWHSITGRNDSYLKIRGGNCDGPIDNHYVDFIEIEGTHVNVSGSETNGFSLAGSNFTLINVRQTGGRALLGIRADTPNCAGAILINGYKVYTRDAGPLGYFYVVGFSNPAGIETARTDTVEMAKLVRVVDGIVDSGVTVRIFNFSKVLVPHKPFGTLYAESLSTDNVVIGINHLGDANYRMPAGSTKVILRGDLSLNQAGCFAAYLSAGSNTSPENTFDLDIACVDSRSLRLGINGVKSVRVSGGKSGGLTKDGAATGSIDLQYRNVEFTGGAFGDIRGVSIFDSLFSGAFTNMSFVDTILRCNRTTGSTGVLTDITARMTGNIAA